MAKIVLTDFKVKALKPAEAGKRYDVMDSDVRGLGVRVNDKGERTFIYYSRFPGGTAPQRRSLGEYPAIGLQEARQKAAAWRELIRQGIDPRERENEAKQQAEAERRRKNETAFENVLERFIKARRRDKIRKADEDERDFNRECLPKWKGRAVATITGADIMEIVEGIADRGAQRQALNIAQKIGTFFAWCVDDEIIETSPYRAKKVRTAIGEKQSRDRVLSDAELSAFWRATDKLGTVYRETYRLLLLTGQRLNDIAQASWSEVDLDKKVLTIPAARFKSNRDHVVPLTDEAIALIKALPTYKGCNWLLSLDGEHSVTIGHKLKKRLDDKMAEILEKPVAAWVNHDLRRTVRTRLSALRVQTEVAEAVIGHAKTGLAKVYDHYELLDEKRDALTRWEGALLLLTGKTQSDNIVAMPIRSAANV